MPSDTVSSHRCGVTTAARTSSLPADVASPLQIRELHVAAHREDAAFSSPLLRTLPFSRMVAAINRPGIREQLRPLMMPANTIEAHSLGSREIGWIFPPAKPPTMPAPQLQLRIPSDRRKPDDFYALVADTYLAQATLSNRAAQDLAAANDIPPSTVHRWLKEARNRGLLRLPQQIDASQLAGEVR